MSQQIAKVKSRIKSVSSALKVTSAMKLISTVKLKKWKSFMMDNKTYADELSAIFNSVSDSEKPIHSIYLEENKSSKKLYVVVTSSLGLCGAYNQNIYKLAENLITKDDDLIILGNKGNGHFENFTNTKIDSFSGYNSLQDSKLSSSLAKYFLTTYQKGIYKEIHVIYTVFKNSMAFIAKDSMVLPIKINKQSKLGYSPIMEPNPETLFNTLIPIVLENSIHAKLLESEVCEQASRSNAMSTATDNAEELLRMLEIEFNKARQASITQEIVEIVGASEAH